MTTVDTDSSPATFLWRRIARIVPAYWIFTTILLLTVLVLPGLFKQLKLDWAHVAASYVFLPWVSPTDGHIAPLLVQGWTLAYEMFFYVVFAAGLMMNQRLRAFAIPALLMALAIAGLLLAPQTTALKTYTAPRIAEFAAGIWLAMAWRHGAIKLARWQAALLLAMGLAIPVLATVTGIAINDRTVLALFGLPALLVVVAGLALEADAKEMAVAQGLRLGDASYSTYLGARDDRFGRLQGLDRSGLQRPSGSLLLRPGRPRLERRGGLGGLPPDRATGTPRPAACRRTAARYSRVSRLRRV
ncbi:MAG: acyltransferase [Hyphomicrobiaceae bacterium]